MQVAIQSCVNTDAVERGESCPSSMRPGVVRVYYDVKLAPVKQLK